MIAGRQRSRSGEIKNLRETNKAFNRINGHKIAPKTLRKTRRSWWDDRQERQVILSKEESETLTVFTFTADSH